MKTSKILAAAAFTLLAAVGAQAETYDGVLQPGGALSRSEVNATAVVAARSENPYADGANAGVPQVMASSKDRRTVQAQAVATAHEPNQNLVAKAFINDKIPAAYTHGSLKIRTRQAAL